MYGFHKIPHLQQGVLRSEPDTEFWNFEHPNFLRGQPNLLHMIQRKKQLNPSGDENGLVDALREVGRGQGQGHAPIHTTNLSPGQILDINSIVNGIAVIKRHQTAISNELSALKTSNEHLWQEALAARDRHKKHQDTINRILKFLAGVFGNSGGTMQVHQNDAGHPSSRNVPRKTQRLMITGNDTPRKEVVEVEEEVTGDPLFLRSQTPSRTFVYV
jgi:hypothetical protein